MTKQITFRANIAPIMSGIRTGNDGMRLTLDIPESDVEDAVPLIALRNMPLKITVQVDDSNYSVKPAKKKKVEKGPFGKMWMRVLLDIHNNLDLLEVLNLDSPSSVEQVKEALKERLGEAESLSNVSPSRFAEWATKNELHQLAIKANRLVPEYESASPSVM